MAWALFERTYTQSAINLCIEKVNSYIQNLPRTVLLSISPRIDCLLRSQSGTSHCHPRGCSGCSQCIWTPYPRLPVRVKTALVCLLIFVVAAAVLCCS
ncbi:hypothetical protein ARMSODRAFT_946653 [Armillaria solidipes]|uniref:Uncharacterized protein n=1 Tax=Armillaria solidipes TaxID=1076256 RepID=A0A2H3CNU9_9AGAR|nr:hypothetical protein ARMSODRAFT_946653 [Armillaria solidipes]